MTTRVIQAWPQNFLRNMRQGHPIEVAARLCGIGMDKIIYERKIDSEFDQAVQELVDSNLRSPQF
jgi:hypothetical protein